MSFIGSYMDYLGAATWLPHGFAKASALMALSTVIDRKVYIRYSTTDYYPNHYCLLVGESNSGKGVAIKSAKSIVSKVAPELVLMDRYTPEGLLHELSEMEVAHGTIFNDEMETLISGKKYMSSMTTNLLELYDSSASVSIRYAGKRFDINEPYFGMFLGIQPEVLGKVLSNAEVSSGFLPRFMIFNCSALPRKKVSNGIEHYKEAQGKLKFLHNELNKIDEPVRVGVDEDAIDTIFDYVDAVKEEYSDNKVFARFSDLLFRTSLLYYMDEVLSDVFKSIISISQYSRSVNGVICQNSQSVKDVLLSKVSNKEVYKPNIYLETSDDTSDRGVNVYKSIHDLLSVRHVGLRHVNMAIDTFNISAIHAIANLISENMDAVVLQRVVDCIMRIISRGTAITTNDNRILIPQREMLRSLGITVAHMKPYIETLIAQGKIGPLVMHTSEKGQRQPCYPYLGPRPEGGT